MPPARGQCVWCDSTDLTVEHVIGGQITKALAIPYPAETYWGRFKLPGTAGEITLRDRVCRTCNENWMRKLDNQMMRLLKPTIHHGAPVRLNEKEQTIVAMWATKVALLLQLRALDLIDDYPELAQFGSGYVPDDHLAIIRKTKSRPPKRTRVWLGAIDPRENLPKFMHGCAAFGRFEAVGSSQIVTPVDHGYHTLIGLSELLVVVAGWDANDAGEIVEYDAATLSNPRAVGRIWPHAERVVGWPPSERLRARDLDILVQSPAEPMRLHHMATKPAAW